MTGFASLCVLSYERPLLLRAMLRTLFETAGFPFELIIHDDGSTDSRVRDLLHEYRNVATVITNPPGWNQGQGVALNRMFCMAAGDPILKLDQDLVFEEWGWLAETVRLLRVHWRIGLLGLCHYFHDPVDMRRTVIERHEDWQRHPLILGSAFAMPRRVWEELGPFEEHSAAFNEDGDMQRRVHASWKYVCALPNRELAINPNMGPGPSTVVFTKPDGQIGVTAIRNSPYIVGYP